MDSGRYFDIQAEALAAARGKYGQDAQIKDDGHKVWIHAKSLDDGVVAAPTLELLAKHLGVKRPRYLTPAEIIKRLGLTRASGRIDRMFLEKHGIPHKYYTKIGATRGRVLVQPQELDQWILDNSDKLKAMRQRGKYISKGLLKMHRKAKPRAASEAVSPNRKVASLRGHAMTRPAAKGSLLEQALAIAGGYQRRQPYSREQMEVVLAYARGEISPTAAATVLKVSRTNITARCGSVLTEAIRVGALVETGDE